MFYMRPLFFDVWSFHFNDSYALSFADVILLCSYGLWEPGLGAAGALVPEREGVLGFSMMPVVE